MHWLPQELTSPSETQLPSQSWRPAGQTPLQAWFIGMQLPAHSFVIGGQVVPHLVPSQVAWPPIGTGQGLQDAPQLSLLASLTQLSTQRWKPGLQVSSHLSPSQVEVPLGDDGQGLHAVPQALRLLASTQIPPHRFFPTGQVSSQASVSATQESLHGRVPAGQETPHICPSQIAVPPLIFGQGSHDRPQPSGEVSSMHIPLQMCLPVGQRPSSPGFVASAPPATPVEAGPSCDLDPPEPPTPVGLTPPTPPVARLGSHSRGSVRQDTHAIAIPAAASPGFQEARQPTKSLMTHSPGLMSPMPARRLPSGHDVGQEVLTFFYAERWRGLGFSSVAPELGK
jgi:hypothetical protein